VKCRICDVGVYHVSGDGADDFKGTLELGYQVSFPWQLGNAINFSYTIFFLIFAR
jgi:hypothetical protein